MSDYWNRVIKDKDGKRIEAPPEGRGVLLCKEPACGQPAANHENWWDPCPMWVDRIFTLAPREHSPQLGSVGGSLRRWEER